LLVVIGLGALRVGPDLAHPPAPPVDESLHKQLWCQGHTGTHPGNSGAANELMLARKGGDSLRNVGIAENGIYFNGNLSDSTSSTSVTVNQQWAPPEIADDAHRFGEEIVYAWMTGNTTALNQPWMTELASKIDGWAATNCLAKNERGT
jgi:hypothetical protein